MSEHINDEYSQHQSDDEASNHEAASETRKPKQKHITPTTTSISKFKLPLHKKEE